MTDKDRNKKNGAAADSREDRLKAALKANMAKRKAQTRARKVQDAGASKKD